MQKGLFLKYSAFALLFALCLLSVKCTEDSSPVLTLNEDNFEDEVAQHKFILLDFYAPWCGHCKTLEPEYEKAAEILMEENSNIRLAKVDATENFELSKRFEVKGYPTLKFLKNGEYIEYTGGRTTQEIVQWVKKKSGPASVQLNTVEEVEQFKTKSNMVLVYFGSQESGTYTSFNSFADKYDYFFAHCFDEAVKSHYNVADNIVLFKNFDELRHDFEGELTQSSFEAFTDIFSLPLVGHMSDRHVEVIFDRNRVGFFYVRSNKSANDVAFDEVLRKIAPIYREQIVFVVSDIVSDLEENLAAYFGIKEANLPQIRISNVINEEEVKNYLLEKPITEANVEEFLLAFLNEELQQNLKSEEAPLTQTEAVYKVVGSTFKDVVINSSSHVLVEFYASWCGHCKKFEPVYEEIAELFKKEALDVVVAKIDATENDVEGINISGFPTFMLFKIGEKNTPFTYEGNRDKLDLVNWVKEHIDSTYQKSNSDERHVEESHDEESHDEENIKEDL